MSGTTRVKQKGHQAELARGDMGVYDSTKPYTVTNVDQTALHYFQIPRSAFALPEAQRIGRSQPTRQPSGHVPNPSLGRAHCRFGLF